MRAALLALVAIGCIGAAMPQAERISIETHPGGPVCGRCTSVKLTVGSDGGVVIETGAWAGSPRVWRTRTRRLHVTPEQYAAFRERLSLYRPVGKLTLRTQPECDDFVPDSGQINLSWRGGGADSDLYYDLGCDAVARAEMRRDIQTAPRLLGLDPLPGG